MTPLPDVLRRSRSAARAEGSSRAALVRRAYALEYVTISWMVIEAGVAIESGVRAGSVSLLAFGVDSVIEIASALILVWRLHAELGDERRSERAEQLARRLAAALLFALAAYVALAAGLKLARRSGEAFSISGLVITVLSMPVMAVLAKRKIALADALRSLALRADAIESVACGYLSLVVIAGLLLEALTGLWWTDAAASLVLVPLLLKEGHEGWRGETCC